jgi:hypothetical protein
LQLGHILTLPDGRFTASYLRLLEESDLWNFRKGKSKSQGKGKPMVKLATL